jgi:hypothetical protein
LLPLESPRSISGILLIVSLAAVPGCGKTERSTGTSARHVVPLVRYPGARQLDHVD